MQEIAIIRAIRRAMCQTDANDLEIKALIKAVVSGKRILTMFSSRFGNWKWASVITDGSGPDSESRFVFTVGQFPEMEIETIKWTHRDTVKMCEQHREKN